MEGLLPHFFVFDFFGNFHLESMKSGTLVLCVELEKCYAILLEVLRFFPLLNLGGKNFGKKSSGWPSRDLKIAVVNPQ